MVSLPLDNIIRLRRDLQLQNSTGPDRMYRNRSDNRLVYSPSDLIQFIESPFASWLDRLQLECPGRYPCDDRAPELELLKDAGNQHELQFLESLRSSGREITSISRGGSALNDTRSALKAHHEIIYQAYLSQANSSAEVIWSTSWPADAIPMGR